MQQNKLIIAIDGPGAAGKSTVAKLLAKKLNLTYIDTGAMYRCLALYAYRNSIDPTDVDALVEGLKNLEIFLDNTGKVYLNGEDVTLKIRTNEVTKEKIPEDDFGRILSQIVSDKNSQLWNHIWKVVKL